MWAVKLLLKIMILPMILLIGVARLGVTLAIKIYGFASFSALGVIRNCGHYDCVPAELVADYFGFVYGSNYICCSFCSCMDSGDT